MTTRLCTSVFFLALTTPAGASPALVDELRSCSRIASDSRRVECYDNLTRSLTQGDAESVSEQSALPVKPVTVTEAEPATTAVASTPVTSTAVAPKTLFGKDDRSQAKVMQKELGVEALDEITEVVRSVRYTPYKKLVIELDNAQVWRQLDTERLPLREGESVVIRSARFGSYLLEKASGSVAIRVKRVD